MSSKPSTASKPADAVALLMADHKAVKALFAEFDRLTKNDGPADDREFIVEQICDELTIHAQIEEEIFYPAARAATKDDAMLDEATVEHATVKDLIAQLETMQPGDDLYDAKVTVLKEYIEHHVKEEEGEMFPKAQKADLDMAMLGEQMGSRKEELKIALGIVDETAKPKSSKANGKAKPAAKTMR